MPHQEIANGIAQVYKDAYGRGPQRIVATITPDTVFVVISEINTPGQNRLVQMQEFDLLETVRVRMQRSLRQDLIAVVEKVLDRRVRCYVAGYNGPEDAATDTFVLAAPVAAPG